MIDHKEKMLRLNQELLNVEENRLAGKEGCSLDELDAYLEKIISQVKASKN